jgi:hypothetical protein
MFRFRFGSLVIFWLGWMTNLALAQLPYSGNANKDDRIDVADVVTMVQTLDQPTTAIQSLDFFLLKLLDVNQDEQIDALDLTRLLDILLGRAFPLPIVPYIPAAVVSFNCLPSAADLVQDELKTAVAKASFWREPSQTDLFSDEHKAAVATASFWYQLLITTPTEVNVWQLGYPSFERQ